MLQTLHRTAPNYMMQSNSLALSLHGCWAFPVFQYICDLNRSWYTPIVVSHLHYVRRKQTLANIYDELDTRFCLRRRVDVIETGLAETKTGKTGTGGSETSTDQRHNANFIKSKTCTSTCMHACKFNHISNWSCRIVNLNFISLVNDCSDGKHLWFLCTAKLYCFDTISFSILLTGKYYKFLLCN